jgi:hypothetical protein
MLLPLAAPARADVSLALFAAHFFAALQNCESETPPPLDVEIGPLVLVVPPPPELVPVVFVVVLLLDELLPHAAPKPASATTQITASRRCGLDRFVTPQTLLPVPESVNVTCLAIR